MSDDVERRPTETEAQLAPAVPEEIVALASSGRRLEAIQRYRVLTGATIEEARQVVMGL